MAGSPEVGWAKSAYFDAILGGALATPLYPPKANRNIKRYLIGSNNGSHSLDRSCHRHDRPSRVDILAATPDGRGAGQVFATASSFGRTSDADHHSSISDAEHSCSNDEPDLRPGCR